jgi:tetratricopeptide (TPR) repeat protein
VRTTIAGSRAAGRVGVVRILLIALATLVVAAAGVFFLLRHARGSGDATDFSVLLDRIDDSLADPDRAIQTESMIEQAESFVRSRGLGVESELSVLKRRRDLAYLLPSYADSYLEGALGCSARFPHSDLAAATVAEAALGMPGPQAEAVLREHLARLDGVAFGALRTFAEARLGSLSRPVSLLSPEPLLAAADAYADHDAALLAVDAALSALLSGDALTARGIARDRLARPDELPERALRFHAELSFDFGDRRDAAALFSRLPGVEAVLLRADSFHLSGDAASAKEAWLSAAVEGNRIALYNLASASADPAEALAYARRLRSAAPDFPEGAVLFSRLASPEEADAALSEADDALTELELIRREAPRLGVDRTLARLWLLANAETGSEETARWGAWYAASNGRLQEAVRLVRSYEKENGPSPWGEFYLGLDAARSGRIDEAEAAFEKAAVESGDWHLAANTAVLSESRRDTREALRRYEIAVSLCAPGPQSADLQLRISRLLTVLGRSADARRVLEYALDQDPGNRRVRAELKRLDGR